MLMIKKKMSNVLLILFRYCCVPYVSDLFNGICSLFYICSPNAPSTLVEGIDDDVINIIVSILIGR